MPEVRFERVAVGWLFLLSFGGPILSALSNAASRRGYFYSEKH
ncbi:MAG: hypothetical protein AVDCRST_MAG14-1381 [uncultured Rubrobacteraceae bacterium]|uniref:Uncharacterized protein n=1 Tax=uncultured Rubrobacteraceae bacterium TaxID=349277 RepID=A0A6J4QT26_9ACTN|nr:MAG: hypothetical protein AVDCRST_MAG14-1381 [uncultured Rubrobacteraceae bacterium]